LLVYDNHGNPQGAYPWGPPPVTTYSPGVLGISATNLHLVERQEPSPPWYELIRGHEPREILCGSIYLFDIQPK
jgi:hypothetical protein